MKRLALAVACVAIAPRVHAQLATVNVTAAQRSAVTGNARATELESAIWTSGKLRSRVFRGEHGTPAANFYVYEYSIDLRDVIGITTIPFLSSMSVDFGPVLGTLDFDHDQKSDQVFVVKGLELGNIAPSRATKSGNVLTFVFDPPVGGGSAPGNGDRTYVFGVLSKYPPRRIAATAQHNLGGAPLSLAVQAPDRP